tara:strand:+ start:387 stop:1586 length:1200 start_codon:yes stop_codon:yes gene_type:complete
MLTIDNFKLSKKNLDTINKWKSNFISKKDVKPLVITGNKGTGKSSLANILLNDYNIILIDYNTINIEDYLKLLLGKKDISMMFSKKEYKAILIDDIFGIKKNIKELVGYFKYLENNLNHPVIITFCNSTNKKLNSIINKSYHIKITYSKDNLKNCVKNILTNEKINLHDDGITNLINTCNSNFNSIKENIKLLKHSNINVNSNLQTYVSINSDINSITNNLIYNDINADIKYLFIKYNTNTNVIFYNIIDNIINLTGNLNTILELYDCILFMNYWERIKIRNHCYNLDYDTFYSVIYPITKLKNVEIKNVNIEYNKYISYSLQYINSINNYHIDVNIYYYFRKCLFNYDINKSNIFYTLIYYVKKYKLLKKNINSVIRLYLFLNNQKSKSYTSIINKLF